MRRALGADVTFVCDDAFYSGRACDLGKDGLFLASEAVPQPGRLIQLVLRLNGTSHRLAGEVRAVQTLRHRPRGCHIAWRRLSSAAERAIEEYLRSDEEVSATLKGAA